MKPSCAVHLHCPVLFPTGGKAPWHDLEDRTQVPRMPSTVFPKLASWNFGGRASELKIRGGRKPGAA